MRAYVIRHGETVANASGILEGRSDGRLTDAGVALAREVGKALSGVRFDLAYTSPLARARRTAEEVLAASSTPDVPLLEDDRLMEVDMGAWEGLRFRPDEREVDAWLCRLFFEDPFAFGGFPDGESIFALCRRTQGFLSWLASRGENKTVLVSTHGCALRAMLNRLYEDSSDFWQGGVPLNCTVSMVEVSQNNMMLTESDLVLYDKAHIVDRYSSY